MFNSMLDELKEALSRNSRLQKFFNVNYFKETKSLKSLQKAEVYLEPKRASTMEFFL